MLERTLIGSGLSRTSPEAGLLRLQLRRVLSTFVQFWYKPNPRPEASELGFTWMKLTVLVAK